MDKNVVANQDDIIKEVEIPKKLRIAFWRKGKSDIFDYFSKNKCIEELLPPILKGNNNILKNGYITQNGKKIINDFLVQHSDAIPVFLSKVYSNIAIDIIQTYTANEHKEIDAWKVCFFYYHIGKAFNFDEKLYPSEQEILNILEDIEFEKKFEEKVSKTIFYMFAFFYFEDFKKFVLPNFTNHINKINERLANHKISDLESAYKCFSEINEIQKAKRLFRNLVRPLHILLKSDTIVFDRSKLDKLVNCSLKQFALYLEKNFNIFVDEIYKSLKDIIIEKFDPVKILSILENFEPSLSQRDMQQAKAEISNIESGVINIENSPLIQIIIPVLTGEKRFLRSEVGELMDDYSIGLARKLEENTFLQKNQTKEINNTSQLLEEKHDNRIKDKIDTTEINDNIENKLNIDTEEYKNNIINKDNTEVKENKQDITQNVETYSTESDATQPNQSNNKQDDNIQDDSIQDDSIQDDSIQDDSIQDDSIQDGNIRDINIQDDNIQDDDIQDSIVYNKESEKINLYQIEKIGDTNNNELNNNIITKINHSEDSIIREYSFNNEKNISTYGPGSLEAKLKIKEDKHVEQITAKQVESTQEQSYPYATYKNNIHNHSVCQNQKEDNAVFEDIIRSLIVSNKHCFSKIKLSIKEQERFIKDIVVQGNTKCLYWISKTIHDNNIIPSWLAEFLHLGTHLLPRFSSKAYHRILEITKIATSKLDELTDSQNIILATAVLRPALMFPSQNLTTIALSLANSLSEYKCTHFFRRLDKFIHLGISIDNTLFMRQKLDEQKNIKYKELLKETEDFLNKMRNTRTKYKPATLVRKDLFSDTGVLGSTLSDCCNHKFNELDSFIQEYSKLTSIDRIIDNNKYNHRIKNKTIEDSARKQLIEDINDSIELAKDWEVYFKNYILSTNSEKENYSIQEFKSIFQNLEVDKEALRKTPEGCLFINQLEILQNCLQNSLPDEHCDPLVSLELWPLTIPCSELNNNNIFDIEELIYYLKNECFDENSKIAASLAIHMMNGELNACSKFLDIYPSYKDIHPDTEILEQYKINLTKSTYSLLNILDKSIECWDNIFEKYIEKANIIISDFSFRGAIQVVHQNQSNSMLENIKNKYQNSLDKYLGVKEINEMIAYLKNLETSQKEQVLNRTKELRQQKLSVDAIQKLDHIENVHIHEGMYRSAWADIAEVEEHLISGKAFHPAPSTTNFDRNATHDFYNYIKEKQYFPSGLASKEWIDASRLQNRNITSRYEIAIITTLLRWLGFTLDQREQVTSEFTTGRPNYWRAISINMEISGPLPKWGTSQHKHLIVFGWSVTPEDIEQLLRGSTFNTEIPITIICFSNFNLDERKKLLDFCSNKNVDPIVIDNNLAYFLARQKKEHRISLLFHIGLAGASYNPYRPEVAGAVPKEMFFGRQEDIRQVLSPDGPCIIYGGRQLGKSALLQQIYRSHLDNNNDGVKVLLHSMRQMETSILDAALKECVKEKIVDPQTTTRTFSEKIKDWLSKNKDMRLLLLFDECDKALDADARKEFAESVQLRDLMQDTSRRFKVVLTGLHSVQRFSHIPNQPLYHFGEPLCIGPLTADAANSLMTFPMSVLGLEFENTQLVQIALNHCNYQPKLIQIFCSELVHALENRSPREPFHVIDKDTILKIYESQNLKKKILECFDMTLNLDERYLVIGYTMAIHHGEGLSFNDLIEDLRYFWPAAFYSSDDSKDKHSNINIINSLRSLLHEMEGLGLVISLGGKYRLRTPNIVELLGGEDTIYTRLDPYRYKEYSPSGNPDELRLANAPALVASQYNQLAEKSSGLYWISGSKALGLETVPNALKNISDDCKLRIFKAVGEEVSTIMKFIRQTYDSIERGGILFWLPSWECPYMERFIKDADLWLSKLRTDRKYVKIVCLIDPSTMFDFICSGFSDNYSSYHIPLLPWTENSITLWCKENTVLGIDSQMLFEETNGWPFMVESRLKNFELDITDNSLSKDFFAPARTEIIELIEKLYLLKDDVFSNEDIWGLIGPTNTIKNQDYMLKCIEVLTSLHIIRQKGQKLYIDSIALKMISGGEM